MENQKIDYELSNVVDLMAHNVISGMSSLQIGKMLYPDGEAVALCDVPETIVNDHETRYTQNELEAGQLLNVCGKFVFIMDHKAKKARGH